MTESLIAILDGEAMGRVERRDGKLRFLYDEEWRQRRGAVPLSLSMPMARAEHPHEPVESFLWGLLPDNDTVLTRWARRFSVTPRNVFALVAEVGEDCAGAVQFVRPDRVAALADEDPDIQWVTHSEIAQRLRTLREDLSAWRMVNDLGRFSLAGAQPKTALQRRGERWGVPSGREPTTHILKPPIPDFDGHVENEHVCLALARSLGLPAARSYVGHFEDEVAIVVERYDRIITDAGIRRVHQEDLCQALGTHPALKYQSDGGPGPAEVVGILREHSSRAADDIDTFVDALALSWMIGGTDAHAKNYSLLLGGSRVRLAPVYDLASVLPYKDVDTRRMRLAMKVGGKYRIEDIVGRHWRKLAVDVGLREDHVMARVRHLAERLPEAVERVIAQAHHDGVDHPIVDRFAHAVSARARDCHRHLTG